MSDEKLVRFPKRTFSHPGAAAQFANDTFQEVQARLEQAMLSGDRTGMEVVIDIYERDIVPNNARLYNHHAYNLCMFGERLQDSEMIGRGVALYKRILADEFPRARSTERDKAMDRGYIGRALIARGEIDSEAGDFHEAAASFETALKSWRACLQFECVQLSVGLGLAHLAILEKENGGRSLDAAGAAIGQAVEFNTEKGGVLWGDLRYAEAKLEWLRAQAGRVYNAAEGVKAADDAIDLYRTWRPQYVIQPSWIVRTQKVRDALAAL